MTDTTSEAPAPARGAAANKPTWLWHPPLPLAGVPVFIFPPAPVKALKWLFAISHRWLIYALLAVVTWHYLQPAVQQTLLFAGDWILFLLALNLALMVLVAGGLHLYFWNLKRQTDRHKFDAREQSKNDRKFLGRHQVRDNIFWSCVSGVTIWTAYEALLIWSFASDRLAILNWNSHPVWFVLLLVAIPFWNSVHFYAIHRLIHWPPLYRPIHAVHHRNVNIGPWSGLSMHPIEHILYFSSVLIHVVLPSHPIHVFFHLYLLSLGAVITHTGFADLLIKDKRVFELGDFHHQLHHRYYNCNYGNEFVPCDKWFGTDHDGTPEATAKMRQKLRLQH